MNREFTIEKAVKKAVPLLIGLMGPSGGGKTYSALRLSQGIQKIYPGDIIGIDTESNRMLHYADMFDFQHIPFREPFGSADYLNVLKFAQTNRPSVIIIDSASHEHEGLGGLLDLHETELDRIAGDDYAKRQRCQMLAWQKPKAERRKLINGLLQMNCNFIFCFRSKESSRPVKGKDGKTEIENFGFVPIAGSEMVFEMTINMLLLPRANGYPTWQSDQRGENMMMKLPEQFRNIFENKAVQLNENIGEQLAVWAAGDEKPTPKAQPKNTRAAILDDIATEIKKHPFTEAEIAMYRGEAKTADNKALKEILEEIKTAGANQAPPIQVDDPGINAAFKEAEGTPPESMPYNDSGMNAAVDENGQLDMS